MLRGVAGAACSLSVMTNAWRRFLAAETTAGFLLLLSTLAAVALANSPLGATFTRAWDAPLAPLVPSSLSARAFVDEGLMALFFLYVGLGIKRELATGRLASLRRASLPIVAALGGMVAPACVYLAVTRDTPWRHGWGIPTATDIAFAVGVMALLGRRAPAWLKVFITALAIADDVGAVVVIALFYAGPLAWGALAVAAVLTALLWWLNRRGERRLAVYLAIGAVLWLALERSGVHATIAGVIVGLAVPDGGGLASRPSPLGRLERALERPVTLLVLPLFALANAGVLLPIGDLAAAAAHPITVGVSVGLVAGKLAGIFVASWLAVRVGAAELPDGGSFRQLACGAALGGIGFTMSMFTAQLAFADPHLLAQAKLGIFAGSLVAAALGMSLLSWQQRHGALASRHALR